jgi:branched-chain amino acid transport system ATP-binding protein
MLAIEKLSVSYGRVQALCEVDLEIHDDGVLHGVIGPNGAGKSTLLDAVCGRRRPTGGAVRYRGEDITRRSVAWRRRHGMARSFQRTSIFQNLTVLEQLRLVAQHLGDERFEDVIMSWTWLTISTRRRVVSPMACSAASTSRLL